MTNIREYSFSDLYEMGSGISSKPEQAGHGSPFVSFSTVFNNFFLPDKLNDLMDTSEREQKIYSVKTGDVLLTRTSETIDELGMSCVVLKDYPKATFSGFVKRLRPSQENITYPRYMGFYLRSKFFRKTMTNNAVLTLRASLNEDIFSYLKLYLPDYETQKRIGDFLYSLNQKISLNNRINAELEAMAKTIYDYWFVQFDFPISKEQAEATGKPKLEGKPYKASGGKMVWSEEMKREVPEDWEIGTLSSISDLVRGVSYSAGDIKDKNSQGVTPILRATNISGNVIDLENMVYVPDEFVGEKQLLNKFDILITMSSGSKDHIGKNGFYYFDEKKVAFGAFCAKLVAKGNYRFYLYSYTQSGFMFNTIRNECLGTNINNLNGSMVNGFKLVVPPSELIESFNLKIEPLFNNIGLNMRENQKLSELRDWLLPMLMNGQVRIKETTQSKIAQPELSASNPSNSYFYQTQLVAAIVTASKKHKITHGEMTLAKYTYLVDKLYNVPTYFNYERLHLGPYPMEMKKIINNKQFFKVQNNEVSVVPQKKEYSYQFQRQVEEAVADLASLFHQYKGNERSHQTELLATVCKVAEDIRSTDLKQVRESMKKWPIDLKTSKFKNKAEKFTEEETKTCIHLIEKNAWQKHLIPNKFSSHGL